MRKKPLVKLGFAVLIAAAALFGLNPAPARAWTCPGGFGSCVFADEICDGYQCCTYYYNVDHPEDACPECCISY
jgi:hypothetical protein